MCPNNVSSLHSRSGAPSEDSVMAVNPNSHCLGCASRRVNTYNRNEVHTQQIVSVTTNTVSLLIGLVTLYVLFRIRRNFRHKSAPPGTKHDYPVLTTPASLIIMLIISQLCRTFWFWVYSVSKLVQGHAGFKGGYGPIPPSVAFCSADGWFIAFGNEGADISIFLIALHTTLTIFHIGTSSNENGLWPYRYYVYTVWIAFPSLMASLVYIRGHDGYLPQGTYCALPQRPFWYRIGLSWAPRYVILAFVIAVYAAVYIYVRYKFADLMSKMSDPSRLSDAEQSADMLRAGLDGHGPLVPLNPPENKNAALASRHAHIKKQLRFMFIYPVVYLLMSVAPFVNHCYGYTGTQSPSSLTAAAIASVTLQCAVDCLVFITREKPWRFMAKERVSTLELSRLKCWKDDDVTEIANPPTIVRAETRTNPSKHAKNWFDVESQNGRSHGHLDRSERQPGAAVITSANGNPG